MRSSEVPLGSAKRFKHDVRPSQSSLTPSCCPNTKPVAIRYTPSTVLKSLPRVDTWRGETVAHHAQATHWQAGNGAASGSKRKRPEDEQTRRQQEGCRTHRNGRRAGGDGNAVPNAPAGIRANYRFTRLTGRPDVCTLGRQNSIDEVIVYRRGLWRQSRRRRCRQG